MKKTIISALVTSVLLSGCGSDDKQTTDNATPLDVQTTFSARYIQTLPAKSDKAMAYATEKAPAAERAEQTSQVRYLGKLEVTNVENNEEQVFDWPVTQTVDAEGNVTTTSHRALTLKPGTYDFALLLTTEGANPKQYLAKALGHEVIEGEQPAIEFIVEPNLGDTITDFDDIDYVSKLAFQWQAEELAALNKPQFGLSVNGNAEQVFEINKETGLAEITMNVEPGEYSLSLRLYDGDLMVGKNEDDATVNFVEGENAQTDIIPLQADVIFEVAEIKDRGNFSFAIPDVLIEEVGGVENLTLKASITAQGMSPQERVLDILDVNGTHIAQDMFETGGEKNLGVHLEFYNTNASKDLADLTPFTRCNTTVTVEANQTLGCKLELKRESIITNRILGTLRINALNENSTPAEGADVFLNGEKVGVTGSEIGAGTFKTHLVAGEYQVEIRHNASIAQEALTLAPLDVQNKQLTLKDSVPVGDGNFVYKMSVEIQHYPEYGIVTEIHNDGKPDFILAGRGNTLHIAKGNGEGFDTITTQATPSGIQNLVSGDINGDGFSDLVALGEMRKTEDAYHLVYLNNGKGEFTLAQQIAVETHVNTIAPTGALTDINKDGRLDLVASIGRWDGAVFLQDDTGQLNQTFEFRTRGGDSFIAVDDLNGDGYSDILASEILLNDGTGTFTSAGNAPTAATTDVVMLADINGDKHNDIFFTGKSQYSDEHHFGTLYVNDGAGAFTYYGNASQQGSIADIVPAIGDVNGDGLNEIISSVQSVASEDPDLAGTKLFRNDGSGNYLQTNIDGDVSASQHWLVDIDNDTDLDLITTSYNALNIYLNEPHN
ncbi:FG-GAP repeat domain-containing protein [Enterovibrio calviensis]|uniref:FG-GAP repeat domain-containing protein n=1 Tax=Enterovibrio calviensis TaxID=91359 RepID=UPI00138DE57D|nr:VCBS repeat-containing protein [Enterovibrio calviensis]